LKDSQRDAMACSQDIETALKLSGNLVLKASPSDIFGWRECVVHAESDRATAISARSVDENEYQKGRKISDHEMETVRLRRNKFHGDWNYEILPS
jgi:hypothetical protein